MYTAKMYHSSVMNDLILFIPTHNYFGTNCLPVT